MVGEFGAESLEGAAVQPHHETLDHRPREQTHAVDPRERIEVEVLERGLFAHRLSSLSMGPMGPIRPMEHMRSTTL